MNRRRRQRWKGWFHPGASRTGRAAKRIWAAYEIAFTIADVTAALLFVAGSALFFREDTTDLGTWMFLFGSICFALKPALRLAREVHYWRLGQTDTLAERAKE